MSAQSNIFPGRAVARRPRMYCDWMAQAIGLAAVFTIATAPSFGARPPGPIHPTLESLVKATPVIIAGTVTDIKPGRVAGSGNERLDFNDVRVTVTTSFKGIESPSLVVEQMAGGRHVVSPEVGPPYRKGERFILFLRQGEGQRYITVVQGRFQLYKGSVRPLDAGPAADSVADWDESRFVEALQQFTQGKS